MNRSHTLLAVAFVWAAAIFLGFWIIRSYGTGHPEELLHVPTTWPPGIDLQRDADRLTLLLVLHPDCDCTRSALASLADIHGRSVGRLAVRIVFTQAHHTTESLEQSDNWLDATRIPDAEVSLDHDGQAVRRFGFRKSGHALLYDRNGLLLFSGGITPSAADHPQVLANASAGTDNPGANAIVLFVLAGGATTTHGPVPGCFLDATVE